MLIPRTWFKVDEFRLEWPPHLQYLFVTCRFVEWPTYNLYQHISSFCVLKIYHIIFSPFGRWAGVSSLEVKYDIFRYGDERTWRKHPDKYSQHKIVDLCPSSMSQIFCSRKKPSRWKNINIHTYTTELWFHTITYSKKPFSQTYS